MTGESVDVFANEITRLTVLAGFKGDEVDRIVKLTYINGFPVNISVELQQIEDVMTISMSDILLRYIILTANKYSGVVAVATK